MSINTSTDIRSIQSYNNTNNCIRKQNLQHNLVVNTVNTVNTLTDVEEIYCGAAINVNNRL